MVSSFLDATIQQQTPAPTTYSGSTFVSIVITLGPYFHGGGFLLMWLRILHQPPRPFPHGNPFENASPFTLLGLRGVSILQRGDES